YDNIRFEEAVKLLSQFRENLLDSPNSNPPNFLIFKTALRLSRVNLKKLGHINQYIELIKNNPKELGESLGTVIWHSRPEIREKKKELEDPQNLDQYFNGFPIYIRHSFHVGMSTFTEKEIEHFENTFSLLWNLYGRDFDVAQVQEELWKNVEIGAQQKRQKLNVLQENIQQHYGQNYANSLYSNLFQN
ncbi:2140_t:CDS:2, partial [Entrophospora sp. SA101]